MYQSTITSATKKRRAVDMILYIMPSRGIFTLALWPITTERFKEQHGYIPDPV